MFGSSQHTPLFGNTAGNTQNRPSLFGSLGTSTTTAQQGPSLFGSVGTQQAQQPANTGLFGSSTQQNQGGGLFGASQPQQQQSTGGLLGGLNTSTIAPSQQQNQQSSFGGSLFNPQQSQQQPRLGSSLLWSGSTAIAPREKTIPDQIQTLLYKWHPQSPDCVFQHYFYNNVPPEQVPYYGPQPGEDERKWEEALSKKPSPGSIPVLGKGFEALVQRLEVQTSSITALQSRLHEINNSLTAMMQNHDLVVSVRTADAKRRHVALSQRCLALATKVQVLRNRGYAMDSAEEELKKKLLQLEKGAFDPVLNGRQEEIWARMSGVRARAKLLQEESERLGKKLANGEEEVIDEATMAAIKKLLSDYDEQLSHLKKELDQIRKEFEEWDSSSRPVPTEGTSRK